MAALPTPAWDSPENRGTIVVCHLERFVHPRAVEVEMGITFRRVMEDVEGGLRPESELRSLQVVGGPLGGFLGPGDSTCR